MVIMIKGQQVLGLIARNVVQLHVLIHSECHYEAHTTVNCLVALQVNIDIAPLEVPDCGVS